MKTNKKTRFQILEAIINKGGLIGAAAANYTNDYNEAGQFILEVKDQLKNKVPEKEDFFQFLGEDLVQDILNFEIN